MKLLILGVNGFLGRTIAKASRARGLEVFGLSRSPDTPVDFLGTYLVGDRRAPQTIRDIVASRKIEAVIDVIPMTLGDTAPLTAALDGRIAQYVMISSCDVYRNYELLHRRATGTPIRTALDEDAPLRTTRYPYQDDYDKIPIEELVGGLASNWTILRLPMIYGPGDRQRRFRWAIQPMAEGAETLVIPDGWANWTTTYGYIDNVAAAIALVVGDDRAFGCVFNVAERVPATHLRWADRIGAAMRWSGDIRIGDAPGGPLARSLEKLDLSVPLIVVGKRIRDRLGFAEKVDDETSLERTIADELSRM